MSSRFNLVHAYNEEREKKKKNQSKRKGKENEGRLTKVTKKRMKNSKIQNSGNLVGADVCIQTKATSFWGKYLGLAPI